PTADRPLSRRGGDDELLAGEFRGLREFLQGGDERLRLLRAELDRVVGVVDGQGLLGDVHRETGKEVGGGWCVVGCAVPGPVGRALLPGCGPLSGGYAASPAIMEPNALISPLSVSRFFSSR